MVTNCLIVCVILLIIYCFLNLKYEKKCQMQNSKMYFSNFYKNIAKQFVEIVYTFWQPEYG